MPVLVNEGNCVRGALTQLGQGLTACVCLWNLGSAPDCFPFCPRSCGSFYMSHLTALWQWITFCFYAASCCPWCLPSKVRYSIHPYQMMLLLQDAPSPLVPKCSTDHGSWSRSTRPDLVPITHSTHSVIYLIYIRTRVFLFQSGHLVGF